MTPFGAITEIESFTRSISFAYASQQQKRIHDPSHTYASRALALGESLTMGKLLGHSDIVTTARYAHLARDSIHQAAERIAGSIADDIL